MYIYINTHICTCYLPTYCACPQKQRFPFPTLSHDRPKRPAVYDLNLIITVQKRKCREKFMAHVKLTLKITNNKKYRCQILGIWNILLICTNKSDASLLSPVHAFFYFF